MKKLNFDGLYGPECYHEIKGFDSRIAIMKLLAAIETMGHAQMSLIYYSDIDKKGKKDDIDDNMAKSIHLRHAIMDLNNSFDLLLQIPWMFYRCWEIFNGEGVKIVKPKKTIILSNKSSIVRNEGDWVEEAEKACDYGKLCYFLKERESSLKKEFAKFNNKYNRNNEKKKPFTIRDLANTIKHRRPLFFDVFDKPNTVSLDLIGNITKERAEKYQQEFLKGEGICHFLFEGNREQVGGKNIMYVRDEKAKIDVEYNGGELFRNDDCARDSKMHSMDDVFKESVAYFDALVDLFEYTRSHIHKKVSFSRVVPLPDETKMKTHVTNLNKYFKNGEQESSKDFV